MTKIVVSTDNIKVYDNFNKLLLFTERPEYVIPAKNILNATINKTKKIVTIKNVSIQIKTEFTLAYDIVYTADPELIVREFIEQKPKLKKGEEEKVIYSKKDVFAGTELKFEGLTEYPKTYTGNESYLLLPGYEGSSPKNKDTYEPGKRYFSDNYFGFHKVTTDTIKSTLVYYSVENQTNAWVGYYYKEQPDTMTLYSVKDVGIQVLDDSYAPRPDCDGYTKIFNYFRGKIK
jgi:hypothetical protein